MAERPIDFAEILVGSFEQMIQTIAQGVAEGQKRLDNASIESQRALGESFPELSKIGYQVTWYHMPEVLVDLKIAVHYEATTQGPVRRAGLFVSPFNAKYKSAFSYSADGASALRLRIVPIPPPILPSAS